MKNGLLAIILCYWLLSCADSNEEAQTTTRSPRVKKTTQVSSPQQNSTITRGTPIQFEASTETTPIDSVIVSYELNSATYYSDSFSYSLPSRKVGTQQVRVKVYCSGNSETHFKKFTILPEEQPREMSYEIVRTIAHNPDDYTQGLLIHDGFLYESTGQRGESTFKKKTISTGETLKVNNLSNEYFGEGLAVFENQFFQLTWTAGVALVYDLDFNEINRYSYQTQGWGLTTFENEFIMTDGSEKLYFMDPVSFTKTKELEVFTPDGKVDALNELEVIDGLLYANVYQEDFVLVIDPSTGEVLQKINFSGLLTNEEKQKADVLNGIAIDPDTNQIYVTGKLWPKLFEVKIIDKPNT